VSDGRDGRRPGDDDEAAGGEPTADTSGLDAGDWLAAQFEDDEDDSESDGDSEVTGQPDVVVESEPELEPEPETEPETETEPEPELETDPELETRALPVPVETATPASFTVPPAPTAESDVVKSSGHPLALDLSALAGAVPPPEPASETVDPAEPDVPSEPESELQAGDAPVDGTDETDVAAPPRWEVPQALAPRPVVVPPVAPSAPAVETGADASGDGDEPAGGDGDSRDAAAPAVDDAPHPDEPGPFTALISPPVPPEPVFPSTFDWSAPETTDDRAEAEAEADAGCPTADVGEPAEEAPVESSAPVTDAHTLDAQVPDVPAPDAQTDDVRIDDAPTDDAQLLDVPEPDEQVDEALPLDAPTRALDLSPADVDATDPAGQTDGDDGTAGDADEIVVVAADGTVLEPVTTDGAADEPMPYGAISSDAAAPADESVPADEPVPADESVPADQIDRTDQSIGADADADAAEAAPPEEPGTPEPWWVAEHHEMTRRERREAEAAGLVVPPAVPAEAAPVTAEATPEAPEPGPETESEREPTFTELLGIVRPSSDAPETVEDTPGELSADAGRSDFVDPGPLPAGGSWALSDELTDSEPAAGQPGAPVLPQHGASTVDEDDLDEPIDPDDPFALLQVEPDDAPADDARDDDAHDDEAAATTALPVAAAAAAPAAERPRTVPQADTELPGLSVEGGSASGTAAASSAVPPLVPRGVPSAAASSSGGGSTATGGGAGEGIASWSRGRKVLLGVAAALVIVLALVALFVLSRSLFAGTPQPTEAPAAAVATRTVTAAPAELPREALVGPLPAGTHPWSDLLGGECFSAFENAWQQDYEVVDCGEPHVAQLASVGALDADPAAAYPGSDALQSQMSVLCTGAGALDLAAASTYPDAQFTASWPATDAEWAAGVRSYWCFVDRAGGEAMTTSVAPSAA
jgi:hypothetical protein